MPRYLSTSFLTSFLLHVTHDEEQRVVGDIVLLVEGGHVVARHRFDALGRGVHRVGMLAVDDLVEVAPGHGIGIRLLELDVGLGALLLFLELVLGERGMQDDVGEVLYAVGRYSLSTETVRMVSSLSADALNVPPTDSIHDASFLESLSAVPLLMSAAGVVGERRLALGIEHEPALMASQIPRPAARDARRRRPAGRSSSPSRCRREMRASSAARAPAAPPWPERTSRRPSPSALPRARP
jgi:hypothetical protein